MTSEQIENIFLSSSNPDELFDAFQLAVNMEIKDFDLYKIMLANPALSTDEIKMFSEKLSTLINNDKYNIYYWTANIFEHRKEFFESLDDSIAYYQKAFFENSKNALPLVHLLGLYNFDFETPINHTIKKFVEENLVLVDKKSRVYFSLADLYKRKGDYVNATRYLALAEKSLESEPE